MPEPAKDTDWIRHGVEAENSHRSALGRQRPEDMFDQSGFSSGEFGIADVPADVEEGMMTYALSIAAASRLNMNYYSDRFVASAQGDILSLQSIRERMQSVLLPNSCLTARAVIDNRGQISVTFSPYFTLNLIGTQLRTKRFILGTIVDESNDLVSQFWIVADFPGK